MSFDRARVRLVAAFTLLSIPAHAVPPSSSAPKTDNPSADSTPPAGPSPSSSAPPAPNDPTSSSQIDPPKLVHYETAVLPDSYSSTEPVAVDLELTIDERGQVAEVNALSALEPEVVASVLRAAKEFTFEPARLNGQAIAVKVPYRYWLEANPKSESTGPAVSSNSPGAASVATSGTSASSKPNDSSEAKPSQPKAAESAVLEDERYEAVATVAAPPREPTRYELKREELTSVPGTRGDPLRAVETLPGVGRSPDGGMPILRGAAQFESATFVDGAGLPFLYHFGGTTSVINPRLIDRVQVVPGNFSSRYGRVAGGIVEVQIKPPERERFGAVADVNLIDSSLLLSSPLGKDTQVAVAGRRSNIDFVFDKLVPKDTFNV
ncbi:MAG TPA: TonB-dependent receptor plug domain-containing protein, partial [Polyangiaceae bacterium]|nr:TonB-dependent receptor plug domain-containing protein [Polyangiaceae bacterium]